MAEEDIGLQAVVSADIGPWERGARQVRGSVGGLVGEFAKLGAMVGSALGGAAVISQALELDKTLANIRSVTGMTTAQMQTLNKALLDIGGKSTIGVQATAAAFYDIVSGVADASTHMAILEAALKTAEAGQADMQATTQGLVQAMNAYGFSANQAAFASDVFTRTVAVGVGTMDEFVAAMGPIIGTSAQVGVKFNDLGAMMAFLTTKGLNTAKAGTTLQAAMMALLNPNAKLIALFKKMGVSSGSAMIKQLGLAGAMEKIKKAVGGSSDKMAQLMGSTEALQAVLALTGGDFEAFAKHFEDGLSGATEAARKLQLESVSAQFEIFKNQIVAVGIGIGQILLPVLGGFVKVLGTLIGEVMKANPALIPLIAIFAGLAAVAGPVLGLLGAIAGPVIAIGVAAATMKAAWDSNFLGIRTTLEGVWGVIKPILDTLGGAVSQAFNTMFGDMPAYTGEEARLFKKFNPGEAIPQMDFGARFQLLITGMKPGIDKAISDLGAGLKKTFDAALKSIFGIDPAKFRADLDALGVTLGNLIRGIGAKLKPAFDAVKLALKDAFITLFGGTQPSDAMKRMMQPEDLALLKRSLIDRIGVALGNLGDDIKKMLVEKLGVSQGLIDAVEKFFRPLGMALQNISQINPANLAIVGVALGVFAVGLKGVVGALNLLKDMVILAAITEALKQISQAVDAAKVGDVGGALVHLGIGIGAVGVALALGSIGSLGTVVGSLVTASGISLGGLAAGLWSIAAPLAAIALVSAAVIAVLDAISKSKPIAQEEPNNAVEQGVKSVLTGDLAPVTNALGSGGVPIAPNAGVKQELSYQIKVDASEKFAQELAAGVPMDAAMADAVNAGIKAGASLVQVGEIINNLKPVGATPELLDAVLRQISLDSASKALLSKNIGVEVTVNVTGSVPATNPPGRQGGGSTGAGIYKVAEGNRPEMFDYGGSQYLMSPGAGYVTPMVTAGPGKGGGGVTWTGNIIIQAGAGQAAMAFDEVDRELRSRGLPGLTALGKAAQAS